MNRTLILTKILLKNGSDSIKNGGKKKLNRASMIIVLILFACVPFVLSIGGMISTLFDTLKVINQQGLILAMAMPAVVIIIFFFGIAYIINTFYFSTDIENLLPLPLKPAEILGAKFATVLVYEYITEAVILIPVFAVYGVKNRESLLFYMFGILIFLILPVIPLVTASIIDMVIMRFTNLAKNKDAFRIFGGIFAMVIALTINIYAQRFAMNITDPNKVMELLNKGNNSLIEITSSFFPSTKIAVYCMINSSSLSGIYQLLIFIIITVFAFLIFIMLGKMLYFAGVIGISETASKRKVLSKRELGKNTRMSPVVYSYTIKELKLLFRTPVYFLNCILMNFLWPIFLMLPIIAQPKSANNLTSLIPYIQNSSSGPMVISAALACGIFITASNMITSTSISREGKNLFFIKYIPVDYTKQMMGKVMSGMIMGIMGMLMIIPIAIFMLKLKVYIVVISFIVSILGIFFSALFGILIDVIMPKLNWDTEQKAVKQNFNGLISIFGSFGIAALIVFFSVKFPLDLIKIIIAVTIIFGIIDFILYKILTNYCVKRLKGIDC